MAKTTTSTFVWFSRLMLIVSVFLVASGIWVAVRAHQGFDPTALLLIGMGILTFGINPAFLSETKGSKPEKSAKPGKPAKKSGKKK